MMDRLTDRQMDGGMDGGFHNIAIFLVSVCFVITKHM